jgi:hypothetical protein
MVQEGKRFELCSPSFVFRLDTADGLRAHSWENRLTGRTLELGNGPEFEIDIGQPDNRLQTPPLEVSTVRVNTQGEAGEAVFTLEAIEPALTVLVTYRWDVREPVLRKFVEISNAGERGLDRLLNVRLGRYDTGGVQVTDRPAGGTYSVPAPRGFPLAGSTHVERGFPVYAGAEFFFTLAHPAGAAEAADGRILLRQYPGVRLAPGETFACMEAVYGVADRRQSARRRASVSELRS